MTREPNGIVSQRIEITPNLIKLRVVPQGWELPDFTPGQYVVLGLPGSAPRCLGAEVEDRPPKDPDKIIMRAYSVASSSEAKEYLEFYIGLVHSGSLSPRLFSLKAGDRVWLSERFKGLFTLSEVPHEFNILLIATGTGVAPYMSMIRTEIAQGLRRRFAVVLGANHSVDLGYHDELKTLDSTSDNFRYLPILSLAHEEPVPWSGHRGFIQDLWQGGTIDKIWEFHPKPDNTHVFLCGNPIMIEIMADILSEEGFKEHSRKQAGQIHLERFFPKAK